MNLLLLAHNMSSIFAIFGSLWLAHAYARRGWRITASLIGLLGFCVLYAAFARNLNLPGLEVTLILFKAVFGTICAFLLVMDAKERGPWPPMWVRRLLRRG